ncbi:hypothetical protein FN846DRAFT_718635 [Sphaerosporella brunnea]|uniref:C2H2-type domain-containing protein n=1 Tax=Sphaerosporella brunnea TaxID=1250544 RepID=A0A5J5EWY8_9PEZI|nr:hypothetical protein FN846DRAFT_718635 [Sphaerosporella brunnea]
MLNSGTTMPTQRISRAKKGKRVHGCNYPGCEKIFTRAEHLRRHQLNHSTEVYYKCELCERTFVRQDLLTRHTERHSRATLESHRQTMAHTHTHTTLELMLRAHTPTPTITTTTTPTRRTHTALRRDITTTRICRRSWTQLRPRRPLRSRLRRPTWVVA